MNAIEELLRGHIRGIREAIAEATSRADAFEALVEKLAKSPATAEPGPIVRKNSWSDDENDVLKLHYPLTGTKGCAERLPHRTPLAIRGQVHRLGLSFLGRSWCDQCSARVTDNQIASCQSKFCPGKARA